MPRSHIKGKLEIRNRCTRAHVERCPSLQICDCEDRLAGARQSSAAAVERRDHLERQLDDLQQVPPAFLAEALHSPTYVLLLYNI